MSEMKQLVPRIYNKNITISFDAATGSRTFREARVLCPFAVHKIVFTAYCKTQNPGADGDPFYFYSSIVNNIVAYNPDCPSDVTPAISEPITYTFEIPQYIDQIYSFEARRGGQPPVIGYDHKLILHIEFHGKPFIVDAY